MTDADQVTAQAEFSMMDLAGLSMDQFNDVRQTNFLTGVYAWELEDYDMVKGESNDKKVQCQGKFKLKVLEVQGVATVAGQSTEELVGKTYTHTVRKNIEGATEGEREKELGVWIGMVKAFCKDIGITNADSLKWSDMLALTKGKRFVCAMRIKPNRDDKDADGFPELKLKTIKVIN